MTHEATCPFSLKRKKVVSRGTAFPTRLHMCPAKIQIILRIRADWSESSQGTQWVAKDPKRLQADSEDSDQTARMRRLIWVFAGRTWNLVTGSVVISSYIMIKCLCVITLRNTKWSGAQHFLQDRMCTNEVSGLQALPHWLIRVFAVRLKML